MVKNKSLGFLMTSQIITRFAPGLMFVGQVLLVLNLLHSAGEDAALVRKLCWAQQLTSLFLIFVLVV